MSEKRYRYLGVQPFKSNDANIFFGRDDDISIIYDLVILDKLLVLFGKSGYGKSSLLNAGLIPKLIDTNAPIQFQYTPIEIRLGTYVKNKTSFSPIEAVINRLEQEIPEIEGEEILEKVTGNTSLWCLFKLRQQQKGGQFILIFDQFEEFFSYPLNAQNEFKQQLAELLYTNTPQYIYDKMDEINDEELKMLIKPMNIKVVFSIRSDRLSLLDSLKDVLPAILHKRYELISLTKKQAREAIVKPARLIDDIFITAPFEFTNQAIDKAIEGLSPGHSQGIEAFQLQILCSDLERKIENGVIEDSNNDGIFDVSENHLPNFENLFDGYYHTQLSTLKYNDRLRNYKVYDLAREILEDYLIDEDKKTGEGVRLSQDYRYLESKINTPHLEKILSSLQSAFLIRRESNTVGGFSYEISHDTLIAPVLKSKRLRQVEIESEKRRHEFEERLNDEADKRASQENVKLFNKAVKVREEAKKLTKKAEMRTQIAISVIIVVIIMALSMWRQKVEAEKQIKTLKDYSIYQQKIESKLIIKLYLKLAEQQYIRGDVVGAVKSLEEGQTYCDKNLKSVEDFKLIAELAEKINKYKNN